MTDQAETRTTKVVGVRLDSSTRRWWEDQARQKGIQLSTLIRRSLESRAKKAQEEEATT